MMKISRKSKIHDKKVFLIVKLAPETPDVLGKPA